MKENLAASRIQLQQSIIDKISALNVNKRYNDPGIFCEDAFNTFFPISLKFVPFEKRYPPEWFNDPDSPEPKMISSKVPLSETWHAMESLKEDNLVKHLGICNYSTGLLHDLMNYCETKPEILQIESHPYLCLLYTSPSPRDKRQSRMPSSA